jgi:ubiquinone biosynthesis protein Coq4
MERPESLELMLDSMFKGWAHGRDTPPLLGVSWDKLWRLRMDQVRSELKVTPFPSPVAAAMRQLHERQPRH